MMTASPSAIALPPSQSDWGFTTMKDVRLPGSAEGSQVTRRRPKRPDVGSPAQHGYGNEADFPPPGLLQNRLDFAAEPGALFPTLGAPDDPLNLHPATPFGGVEGPAGNSNGRLNSR